MSTKMDMKRSCDLRKNKQSNKRGNFASIEFLPPSVKHVSCSTAATVYNTATPSEDPSLVF